MKRRILITGMSGAGKSTVAEALIAHGMHAIDMEEIPDLYEMYYKDSGLPVQTEYENHDLKWVQNVEWICDRKKLEEVMDKPNAPEFYCGSADNIEKILPLFNNIILLQIDDDTFRRRLSTRTNNSWAQTRDVQDWLLKQRREYEEKVLCNGGIAMNASRPLQDSITDIRKIAGS